MTISRTGRYTDCAGDTSYFDRFRNYFFGRFQSNGDSASVTADTSTHCSTTFSPPLTTYRKVNYIIAKSERSLYLLSCTQTWKRNWSECPAFAVGASYTLTVRNTSDARLEGALGSTPTRAGGKPTKLEYLSYVAPSATESTPAPPTAGDYLDAELETQFAAQMLGQKLEAQQKVQQAAAEATAKEHAEFTERKRQAEEIGLKPGTQEYQEFVTTGGALKRAKVHITSAPSSGEIYIDGKFFGNTPSDVTLPIGEHLVKVTIGGKEWTRSVQITSGEISLHAEMPAEGSP